MRALLRPQIAIRKHVMFERIIFSSFWPLKIEISEEKNYMVITVWGFLTILAFEIFKNSYWLKTGQFKTTV